MPPGTVRLRRGAPRYARRPRGRLRPSGPLRRRWSWSCVLGLGSGRFLDVVGVAEVGLLHVRVAAYLVGRARAMTWPKSSTCTVPHTRSTRSVSCSTTTTARPSAARDVNNRPSVPSRVRRAPRTARRGGGPFGSVDRARASSTRRADPVGGTTRVHAASSRRLTVLEQADGGRRRRPAGGLEADPDIVRRAERREELEALNVRARPRRARRWALMWVTSVPSRRTEPWSGRCSPVMTLNSVVLPAPLGPIRPAPPPPRRAATRRRARRRRRSGRSRG